MLSISNRYYFWVLGFLVTSKVHTNLTDYSHDFVALSKGEFCSGRSNLRVNPKYIPELIDYLNVCIATSAGNSSKQDVLVRLFDSATPIVHKAFFDRKTGLKEVILFTKIKNGFVKLTGQGFYDSVIEFHPGNDQLLTYSPEDDQGSYVIEEDIRSCSKMLNSNAGIKSVIKSGELPRVAKSAQTITFPSLNITIGTTRDDVPYLILDSYVLATRCLSFTNMTSETAAMVSKRLIQSFKEKIMPYVDNNEFERTYSRIMSVAEHPNMKTESLDAPDSRGVRHSGFPQIPFNFELRLEVPNTDEEGVTNEENCVDYKASTARAESPSEETKQETTKTAESATIAGWTLKEPLELMNGKLKPIQIIHEKGSIMKDFESFKIACHDQITVATFVVTAAVVGCLLTLAAVIYCLVRGHCGYVTVWPQGEDEYDEEAYGSYNTTQKKNPSFWRLPFRKNRNSKAAKTMDDDMKATAEGKDSIQEQKVHEDKQNSDGSLASEENNYDEYLETNLKVQLHPEDSKTRLANSEGMSGSSEESTGDLVILTPNHTARTRKTKRKERKTPAFCAFTDSNQVDVLATLHKRCEVLSKRICDVVRKMANDTVFEESTSIESLRKFVRSVSHEVVHDGDTIRCLRSRSLDPLMPDVESLSE